MVLSWLECINLYVFHTIQISKAEEIVLLEIVFGNFALNKLECMHMGMWIFAAQSEIEWKSELNVLCVIFLSMDEIWLFYILSEYYFIIFCPICRAYSTLTHTHTHIHRHCFVEKTSRQLFYSFIWKMSSYQNEWIDVIVPFCVSHIYAHIFNIQLVLFPNYYFLFFRVFISTSTSPFSFVVTVCSFD